MAVMVMNEEGPLDWFAGAAEYYRRFRPGIPAAVADVLGAAARGDPPRRLLDVATGTGQVVEALLGHFDDVIAIDAEAAMVAEAERVLRPKSPSGTRLEVQHSTAEQFIPPPGWRASLVTICRAFHWLDQGEVLRRLAGHVAADGAVAIFSDGSLWTYPSPWTDAVRRVISEFLGEQRRAGDGVFAVPGKPFREVLGESVFNWVTEVRVPVRRVWSCEQILGYLYSTSFAAPRLFGGQREGFEASAREALGRLSDDDSFIEDAEFHILIGRRS